MKKHPFRKLCSVFLVTALLLGMLPAQVWAQENKDITSTNLTAALEEAYIVEEAVEKRSEYVKQFRLSNGLYVAAVYAEPVHYEKDGGWAEIDNTLQMHLGTFTNTEGVWDVELPQQLGKNSRISITKDGYTLSFSMAGELRQSSNLEIMSADGNAEMLTTDASAELMAQDIQPIFTVSDAQVSIAQVQNVEAVGEALTYPEMALTKVNSRLQYADVYGGTDILYDLQSNQVKESIILESYSSTLRGYQYYLEVGELIPVLDEEKNVLFYDAEQKDIVMVMTAPFLVDAELEFNYDIQVKLQPSGDGYMLTYILPQTWLADSSRAWPVTLDPVVKASLTLDNVQDQTVMSEMNKSHTWGMIQAGYYSKEGISRFYVMYKNLPVLTSADVILDATVELYTPVNSNTAAAPIQVHKVLETWKHNEMYWSNMAAYDEDTIEDFQYVKGSGFYKWNITDIVRGWYSGENTGMMFKCQDSVEQAGVNNFKQFYSSNYGVQRPELQIYYRNNNGLESYWDYTAHSAGRAGTGYINNFTGNLVWVRNDIGFSGNRMPVAISHVFNTGDKDNNEFRMGNGWRTNYNQKVYHWTGNTAGTTYTDYYVWEDGDGTKHYFYQTASNTYKDEDGLELELKTNGSGSKKYTITDKNENKSYFDTSGRLTGQENNQQTTSSVTVSYNADGYISQITDGAGRVYAFTYTDDLLSKIAFLGTGTQELSYVTFGYSGTKLTSITDKDNRGGSYAYDANGLLTQATDADGYKLIYTYNEVYADENHHYQPYRVIGVSEADGNKAGGTLAIEYAHNQTTFTDHNGHKQIVQFNDLGNTVSIQDGEGRAQHAAYALNNDTEVQAAKTNTNDIRKVNQMISASRLQNTVSNLLADSSFENGGVWSGGQITAEESYLGSHSLAITDDANSSAFLAKAGKSYTFSAYVKKGTDQAYLCISTPGNAYCSELGGETDGWTRLQVAYTNNTDSDVTATVGLRLGAEGVAYIDCVQLEEAPTASRYNLVDNGDFRTTDAWSSAAGRTMSNSAAPQLSQDVYSLSGTLTSQNRISQTIPVSGGEGDTFVVTGWAKGNSTPLGALEYPTVGTVNRTFSIIATFLNGTAEVNTKQIDFNPDVDNWQYVAAPMIADGAYTAVKIELAYDYNANTVCFDGIQLYKEQFGSSYTYDKDGNVISVVDLQKQTTTYEYDTSGNLTQIIQDNKAKMTYEYDAFHNVTSATSAENLVYNFAYDDYGNNISVAMTQNGMSMQTSAVYSTDGNRLESTTDAAGGVTTYQYDQQTNVLQSVQYPNGAGTATTYTYDEMYRTASVAANAGEQTLSATYTYTDDLLTAITTGSTTYSFEYGDFAMRSAIKAGEKLLASYEYTDNENKYLDTLAYDNGDGIEYTYDDYGRVIAETYEDGDTVRYQYDNDGALATMTDATGRKTTYYYDFTDRLMKYVESGSGYSHSVGYEYDLLNNLTRLVETVNGNKYATAYTYDEDNRIKTVTAEVWNANGNSVSSKSTVKTYSYDAFGRVSGQTTAKNGTNVLTQSLSYRTLDGGKTTGQVASLTTTAANYNVAYSYTYDANGNITSVSDGTYTTTYTYDSQNQLIREDNQQANKTWTWEYDNAGNILSKQSHAYTTGDLGAVQGTVTYGYNSSWGDELTSYGGQAVVSDKIGNITTARGLSFTWEHGRQLATLTKGATTWTYTYDANGMRTSRGNGSKTYHYTYNGGQLTQLTVDTYTLSFAYDAAGAPMTLNINGTTFYYVTNLQGDVVSILKADGTEVVRYTYDAWGKVLSTTGTMAASVGYYNPLRYRGYVYDRETELYYLQSRYYDPQIGRFISADAFTSTGQGLLGNNMFAYCGNNPVVRTDGEGLYWETALDVISLIGSVIDVICNPDDVWAWVGVVADVASLVLPVVACGGTWVKAATKADDVIEVVTTGDKIEDAFDAAGDLARKTDFYVTPSGEAIPSTLNGFNDNLSKLDYQNGKYVGEDSNGPIRIRVNEIHVNDPSFSGVSDPLHTDLHFHIDRRVNKKTGKWVKIFTGPMEMFD